MRNILRFRVVAIVLLALGLFSGTFANVGAQATPVVDTGTLVVSQFLCPDFEEATATVSAPMPSATASGVDTSNCAADTAVFQVFANADFESEPVAELDASQASVDLAAGTGFALLDPEQNVFFTFDIAADAVTTIMVLNPVAEMNAATPVDDNGANGDGVVDDTDSADNGGSATDGEDTGGGTANGADGTAGGTGVSGPAGANGAGMSDGGQAAGAVSPDGAIESISGKGVSILPSTGQGGGKESGDTSIVLLLSAMSLVVLAAGIAWRQRRVA